MNIVVIGSLSRDAAILEVKSYFKGLSTTSSEINVVTPMDKQGGPLLAIQEEYVDKIAAADLVIAVPKGGASMSADVGTSIEYNFGESTSYEMAIARHFHIPILIWG